MFSIYFTFRWIVFHCNVVVLSSFRYFWWISLFNLLHSYTNRIDWSGQILDWMGDPSKEPLSRSSHWQIPHSLHLLWGLAGPRALQRLYIFQNWCSGQHFIVPNRIWSGVTKDFHRFLGRTEKLAAVSFGLEPTHI